MARGITENDVWIAADALLLEGARPTIERVRQKIGRGSPNTVSPHLDTWFKHLGARIKDPRVFSAPPDIPDPVVQVARHLWEAAQSESRRDFDERLKKALEAAETNLQTEKERATIARAAAAEATDRASRSETERDKCAALFDQERLIRVEAEARLSQTKTQIADFKESVERISTELSEVRLAARGEIAAALERSAGVEKRAALQIDEERTARAKADRLADTIGRKLQAAENETRTVRMEGFRSITVLRAEVNQLSVELQTSRSEQDRLRDEAVRLVNLSASQRQEIVHAQGETAALRAMFNTLNAGIRSSVVRKRKGERSAHPKHDPRNGQAAKDAKGRHKKTE